MRPRFFQFVAPALWAFGAMAALLNCSSGAENTRALTQAAELNEPGTTQLEGRVSSLHIKLPANEKDRGLCKPGVPSASLKKDGFVGDYNKYRCTRLNNTPDRAVSLITRDALDYLHENGWPMVTEGDLGLNIIVDGITYSQLVAAQHFKLGSNVEIELTEQAAPCKVLKRLIDEKYFPQETEAFRAEKFAAFINILANRRGWYAKVITEGSVNAGDATVYIRK